MTATHFDAGTNRSLLRQGLVLALFALPCITADFASAADGTSGGDVGIKRLLEPQYPELELTPERPKEEHPVLPPAPPAPKAPAMYDVRRIFVRSINVQGNTLLSDSLIRDLVAPYENRQVTVAELHELRHQLSQAYYDLGYINSGAVIPDQQVVDGKVTILIVEGVLSQLNLAGNKRLRDSYIRKRVSPRVGETLNANTLRDSLELLQRNPLIDRVNARLLPGDAVGRAILDMKVREAKPYTVGIGVDNYRSPSVGAEHAYLFGVHRNLTGNGDQLSAEVGITDGLDEIDASYQIPVSARDTLLGVRYERTDSKVVEDPFEEIDVKGKTDTASIYLAHPLRISLSTRLAGLIGFDVRHSQSYLLGEPFSFSPGVQNGESDVRVLWTGLEWTRRGPKRAMAVRGTYRQGLDVLDATDNSDKPDGVFSLFLFQFQYLQRLDHYGMQIVARSTLQRSLDPLLPIEKFGVGGRYSVRGYRENEFVRDNGVAATLEGRIPLFQDENNRSRYNLTLAGFLDYGRSWDEDNDLPTSHVKNITSIGAGMIWNPVKQISSELYWAYALDNVDTNGNNLQDKGISFSLVYRFL